MKYKIEKNTVQETLILPLYSRSLMQRFGAWDSRLQVTSRGCMLGYNDLKDPSVGGFFRFLARVGDSGMKMQIVKIRFTGKN